MNKINKEELKNKVKRIGNQAKDYLNERKGKEHKDGFDDFADKIISNIAVELHLRPQKEFLRTIRDFSDEIYNILDDTEENEIDIEELKERINEIDIDSSIYVYTSDLTAWLNEDDNNVNYLTDALEEFNITDGFQALEMAQLLYKESILYELTKQILKEAGGCKNEQWGNNRMVWSHPWRDCRNKNNDWGG